MELKVVLWVTLRLVVGYGIHSMELKGSTVRLKGHKCPCVISNPFNGIESPCRAPGTSIAVLVLGIHSMELKVAIISLLSSCGNVLPLNPFNGIERSRMSRRYIGNENSTESIQWNWKADNLLPPSPRISNVGIHSMELKGLARTASELPETPS